MAPSNALLGRSRQTSIRRNARGEWFDGDEPLAHPGICRAFDRWIARAQDGRYCLLNAVNWAYVEIEGAPIFVRRAWVVGETIDLHLSDDRVERLVPSTLRQGLDGALYCTVREGTLPACFDRNAMAALSDDAYVFMEHAGVDVQFVQLRSYAMSSEEVASPRALS